MITPNQVSHSAGTVPVPLAALAVDGVSPAEGDSVTFTVTGRILSTDGTKAQVQVDTINDQPAAMSDEAEDRAMMEEAMKADNEAEGRY